MASSLEELFSERKAKEAEIAQLEEAIAGQKRANQQAVANMV